jgi:hypothetical protein
MPKNKNAYLRYLIIHSQLKRNKYKQGYPKKEDLLWVLNDQGYDVSGTTLEKDLNFLKNESGAPLEYNRYQKCYRYIEDWEFDIPLSPEDVRILHMLIHKLEIFGDAQEFKMVKDSIDRLSDHFNLMHNTTMTKLTSISSLSTQKDLQGNIFFLQFMMQSLRKRRSNLHTAGLNLTNLQSVLSNLIFSKNTVTGGM